MLPNPCFPPIVPTLNSRSKILSLETLPTWRAAFRDTRQRLVVTNGCFDLIHAGHVTYLESARNQGDALLVGVNGDAAVRQLKGENRPYHPATDRALVLAALAAVDAVCVFPESVATHFLDLAQPDLYVKGGDYRVETLNQDEVQAVRKHGGHIVILPFLPGRSTTGLLKKISTDSH